MELDHVILFVPGLDAVAADLAGFTLDPGRRHTGQGTVNRRIVFERNYLEIVWIDVPEEVRARGLGFELRCGWEDGACPFGMVARGPVPEEVRPRFVRYDQPDAPGFSLLLLRETLQRADMPFLAVIEMDAAELVGAGPRSRAPATAWQHANRAASVVAARFSAPAVWTDGDIAIDGVEVVGGPTGLELTLEALDGEHTIAGRTRLRGAAS